MELTQTNFPCNKITNLKSKFKKALIEFKKHLNTVYQNLGNKDIIVGWKLWFRYLYDTAYEYYANLINICTELDQITEPKCNVELTHYLWKVLSQSCISKANIYHN